MRSALVGNACPPGRSTTFRLYVLASTTLAMVNGSSFDLRNQCRLTSSPRPSSLEPITSSAPSSTVVDVVGAVGRLRVVLIVAGEARLGREVRMAETEAMADLVERRRLEVDLRGPDVVGGAEQHVRARRRQRVPGGDDVLHRLDHARGVGRGRIDADGHVQRRPGTVVAGRVRDDGDAVRLAREDERARRRAAGEGGEGARQDGRQYPPAAPRLPRGGGGHDHGRRVKPGCSRSARSSCSAAARFPSAGTSGCWTASARSPVHATRLLTLRASRAPGVVGT